MTTATTDDSPRSKNWSFRIGAIGDLHLRTGVPPGIAAELARLAGSIDLLIVAGDITDGGKIPEVALAAGLFGNLDVPTYAVLGNHDRRGLRRRAMRTLLESSGMRLLDGDAIVHRFADGRRIGLAGVGGYGGGFWPEEAPDLIHTRLSKAVGVRARREAMRLDGALASLDALDADATLVVMHYSPTVSTLGQEPPLKYWMLGNSLLGKVIDDRSVDLVIHGHAHLGNQVGQTPGGTPVRNVATPVTGGPVILELRSGKIVREVPISQGPWAAQLTSERTA